MSFIEELLYRALKEIKESEGKVCNEYEICTHQSCASSCNAWQIAEKALREYNLIKGEL